MGVYSEPRQPSNGAMGGIRKRDFRGHGICGLLSARDQVRAWGVAMYRLLLPAAAFAAAMSLSTASAQAPVERSPAKDAAAAAAVERARAAAGDQWSDTVEFFCGDSGRANRADDPVITPTRVFDNLYALGRTSTVIWAVTTPAGILLIDAGYPDQLESVLLPGLRAAGLDPNDVKYVLARARARRSFRRRVVLSGARRAGRAVRSGLGLDRTSSPPRRRARRPAAPLPSGLPPPHRDVVVTEGEPIVFGGLEITPVLMPGHTPGSLGFVFAVQDGGRAHTAALFGGSILLSGRISDDGLRQYVRSVEHFADVTSRRGVDVEIQNHPLYDGFGAKLDSAFATQPREQTHPFVVGPDAYQRFLTVMAECGNAQLARR